VLRALTNAQTQLRHGALEESTLALALSELDRLPPAAVTQCPPLMAEMSACFPSPRLWRLFLSGTERRARKGPIPDLPDVGYLFLFDRDGFVREEALTRLSGSVRCAFFFAAVAYRINDWVPAVRRAAQACAERMFPMTDPMVIAEAAVTLLGRRLHWHRWDPEDSRILDSALTSTAVVERLAHLMRNEANGPLTSAFGVLAPSPALDPHLPELACGAVQPSVRAAACQVLIEGKARWPMGFEREWVDKVYGVSRRVPVYGEREVRGDRPREQWVEQAARDKSAAVRRVAAAALLQHQDTLANLDEMLAALADDPSPAIRERIAFVSRQRQRQ
jgi:hypothetical protein